MRNVLNAVRSEAWELVDVHASAGSTGPWPHVVAVWRATSADAIERALSTGDLDEFDESGIVRGRSTLMRGVRGAYPDQARAIRYERVVASDAAALDVEGPDFVLADVLCPWQGIAMWGASDFEALSVREHSGMGWVQRDALVECVGWWVSPMPDREIL